MRTKLTRPDRPKSSHPVLQSPSKAPKQEHIRFVSRAPLAPRLGKKTRMRQILSDAQCKIVQQEASMSSTHENCLSLPEDYFPDDLKAYFGINSSLSREGRESRPTSPQLRFGMHCKNCHNSKKKLTHAMNREIDLELRVNGHSLRAESDNLGLPGAHWSFLQSSCKSMKAGKVGCCSPNSTSQSALRALRKDGLMNLHGVSQTQQIKPHFSS